MAIPVDGLDAQRREKEKAKDLAFQKKRREELKFVREFTKCARLRPTVYVRG